MNQFIDFSIRVRIYIVYVDILFNNIEIKLKCNTNLDLFIEAT